LPIKDVARLESYLDDWRNVNVNYRQHDCIRFAAGWVKEVTGKDPLASIPPWQSKASGLRIILSRHDRLADWATDILGAPVSPLKAGWGDIAAVSEPPFDCFGIIDGRMGIFLSPHGGLKHVPLARCQFAWVI
jgi:hypothetical protein